MTVTNIPPTPIPDSYWVLPGRFLAGEYPGAIIEEEVRRKARSFLEAEVNFFIDLTEPGQLIPYQDIYTQEAGYYDKKIEYQRFAIQDFGVPSHQQMRKILNTIDEALAHQKNVYVHCWGGIGRTGTVVGCYLVRHGKSGPEALKGLAEMRKHLPGSFRRSPESDPQWNMVLEWKE